MDAYLLAKSLDEFSARPGRKIVSSVCHVAPHVLCLDFGDAGNAMLFLSADPAAPGLWTSRRRKLRHSNTQTERVFAAHLESAELVAVSSEDFERIACFEFAGVGEFDEPLSMTLISEFTGRNSNVILKSGDDGNILACLRTISIERNKYREIRRGTKYVPPPPQDKIGPDKVGPEFFADAETQNDISRRLVSAVAGVSPPMASEIALRAEDKTPGSLRESYHQLVGPLLEGRVEPTIVYRAELPVRLLPFVPTSPDGEIRTFHSALEACRNFYEARFDKVHSEELKKRIKASLQSRRRKLTKTEESLLETEKESVKADRFENMGNLILTNIGKITRGDRSARLLDYSMEPPEEIIVDLDPSLEPAKNAETCFKKAKKLKRAAKKIPKLLAETREKLADVERLEHQLERAQRVRELEDLASEVIHEKPRPGEAPPRKPYTVYRIQDQWDVLVGRSSADNDTLTHRVANPGDLWFHAYQAAGSHVVLRCGAVKREPDRTAIILAAQLAAFYSKARTSKKVPVLYTEKRYVRKPRRSKPGLAVAERFKTVMVEPRETGKRVGTRS
jgi:predicted ribosome quality control (RQC) complex YloA/Tae2 family protein